MVVKSLSEEKEEEGSSEYDDEDMTLFMKKFKKYIKKRKFTKVDKKLKTTTKRICYNCGKHGHCIANYPFERRDDGDDRRNTSHIRRIRATKEATNPTKGTPMVTLTSSKNGSPKMRALTSIVMVWQPWLSREIILQASLSS
jgi:hypothetical protein